ncbi:DNA-binding protein SATB2 [Aphelenchoides avenae]|nr:DNA-binding protein SATB2 [Aphelenchus avenae]
MLPVHVVVISAFAESGDASKPMMDNYAIIDNSLKLSDIVAFALSSLGLGHLATVSKGFILFDNWKPLSFEDVTDDQDVLVIDLLKPVAHTAVLKIIIGQERMTPSSTPEVDVASEPLDLSQGKARKVNVEPCQMDSEAVDSGSEQGSDSSKPCDDQPPMMDFMLQQFLQQQVPLFEQQSGTPSAEKFQPKMAHSPAPTRSRYNPMEQAEKSSLVRFDPATEVPKLHDRFAQNQFPSKALCQTFADEFNAMPYRQANPPLSSTTVYNWFKNHRSRGRKSGMHFAVKAEIVE